MTDKLLIKERVFIGSLIFGLFFGAGNLIFPIQMGQEAGENILVANIGFLITGIGLPFLGIIAFGLSSSKNLIELSSRVDKKYALVFTSVLYLVVGPFFAMPRLASTSFEIALSPFISQNNSEISLLIFSILFFSIVYFFSRKPSRILDYIGKFLTPLFLIMLSLLLILAFMNPLGNISGSAVQSSYTSNAFFKGFIEGYNTLDALAALAFGMIIIENINDLGVKNPKITTKEIIKSGAIGIFLMGIIYTLLAILGTMSLGEFPLNRNGGITLSQVAQYYLGDIGSILLAGIVIVACLKTAIGLATSFGRTFSELYPSKNYSFFTIGSILLAMFIANIGLDQIIQISLPVLMFITPLTMTLIIMGIFSKRLDNVPAVYKWVTYLTMIASSFDTLNALPMWLKDRSFISGLLQFAEQYIPFFRIGMGWVIFSIVGLIIGLLVENKTTVKIKNSH